MQVRSVAHELIDRYAGKLDQMSIEFAGRVFATPQAQYINRLKAIGFEGMKRILDYGCGFGQWSIALAGLNERVLAVDIDHARVFFLESLCQSLGVENLYCFGVSLEQIEEEESFDGIFCYGVLSFLSWRYALIKFHEFLKPGGRLYITANGLGWYLHLWKNQPNKTKDYNPRKCAALTLLNTVDYEENPSSDSILYRWNTCEVIICEEDLLKKLDEIGFDVIACGDEGSISLTGQTTESFFRGEYEGHRGVYEALCQKR